MLNRHLPLLGGLALVAALSVGLAGCEAPARTAAPSALTAEQIAAAAIIKSPNDDRQYQALLLPNGLQVVLVSDPSLENSAASLAVGVGSAHNPPEQLGLAHYLEHMLFLGTEKFPEPDGFMKYTQANGGMTNAYTAYDKTNYMFQINASKFDEALDRFSDYFKKPTFDPHYSDKERNAVHNEWSLQKAQDGWNLFALMGVTANPQSPAAKFNIGNLDTLSDKPAVNGKPASNLQEELLAFYERYYSANIMKLALVGKQPLPELKALAEKYFAAIPNHNVLLPRITTPGLTSAEMGKSIYYKPIKDLRALYVDFPLQSNKDQWRLKPNEYINNLLTSEEPGTLGEQLRQMGLARSVTAFVAPDIYGPDGILRVQAELTDAGVQQQDKVIAAIFSYIDLIKRDGLNKNYYRELQAMSSKDFANASKPQPLEQAVGLAEAQFELPVQNLLNAGYVYERYDARAIKAVLAQLDKNRARIWYIHPGVEATKPIPFFDGHYAIRDTQPEEYERWQTLAAGYRFSLPPLNDLFTDKQAPVVASQYTKPHVVVSQPGLEALLVQPQFYREDKGALTLQINVDFARNSVREAVLANLLNEVYNKQNLTLIDRAGRASLGVNLHLTGSGSQGISLQGYTSKHELLLTQLLHNFVNLQVSEQQFADAQDSLQKNLSNRNKDQVFRQLFGHLARLTSAQSYSVEEQLAVLPSLTPADLTAYHKAVKANVLLRILAAGNYSEAQVKHLAQAAAAILPGTRLPETRAVSGFVLPTANAPLVFNEQVALADSALLQAWFRPAKSDAEQATLAVLSALYGNAFFMQLRTNEQLGYAVMARDYGVDEVPGFMMLVQSSSVDLPHIKARIDQFRREYLATLKAMDEAEVNQARQAIIANLEEKPSDFYSEMSLYFAEFIQGKYAFDSRERELAALRQVTKADVVRMYEQLLYGDNSATALLQLRGTNFEKAPYAPLK